jgi:hypothetical protein
MQDDRLRLVCHYCQTTSVKDGCTACAELRATWAALAESHAGREVPRPHTVEVSGPGLVLTHRDPRGGWIAILVISVLMLAQLALVLLLTRRPEDLFVVFAILGAVCLIGVAFSIRGLLRRRVIRVVDGALTFGEGSKTTSIPSAAISQLVVHANHSSYSHKSHLRTFLSAQLLARTPQGDVPMLKGPFEDVRFVESQIERHLWIQDVPRQNALTTSG